MRNLSESVLSSVLLGAMLLASAAPASADGGACVPLPAGETGVRVVVPANNQGPDDSVAQSCSYVSRNGGAGAQSYSADTPNTFTISVDYSKVDPSKGTVEVVHHNDIAEAGGSATAQGTFTAPYGTTVIVKLLNGCPQPGVCGATGTVQAGAPDAPATGIGGGPGTSGQPSHASRGYRLVTTMTGPSIPSGPAWIGDLGWVAGGRFYFADVSNKQVDVFSAQRLRFVGAVPGFALPSAIATVGNTVWATDGDSTAKVIDPRTLRIRASIATHGKTRADDLAWDPSDNVVVVVNSGEKPPFLSFIKPATRKLAGRLSLRSATDVGQPIWDPKSRLFFVPVSAAKGGAILGISPSSRHVIRTYHIACAPSGFVLGPREEAAIACDKGALIVNLGRRGRIVKRFPKLAAGDQVAYDSGLRRYYLTVAVHTSSGSIAVIDAVTHRQIAGWKVGMLTHSLGVDSVTHRVFVPGSTGVTVYAPKK